MSLSLAGSIALGTFVTVILAIASNRVHLVVAAMLGTVVLLVTGVLSAQEASETIDPAEGMIALFFGGMVMARTLISTGLFDYLGAIALRLVRGDGRRLMFAITALAAPLCAFLPNATVVILLGPLIVALCQRMKIDFVEPVILLVFIANSSGLLTLVGDAATFIVSHSIGLSFTSYLEASYPRRRFSDRCGARYAAVFLPVDLAHPGAGGRSNYASPYPTPMGNADVFGPCWA